MKRHFLVAMASIVGLAVPLLPTTVEAAYPGDNGKIVFVRSEDGNSDIYTMNANGTEQVNLTADYPTTDDQPQWSPDGTKIAFTSDRSGNFEVWVMDADGSDPTKLTTNAGQFDWHPTWSPDGASLAFLREGEGEQAIYKKDLAGGPATLVFDGAWTPAWSPLGNRIAMVSMQPGDSGPQIYTSKLDGSGLFRVTNDNELHEDLEWSPDGQTIAYLGFQMEGEVPVFEHIYRVDADGLNQAVIYDGFNSAYPAWSPDGTQIAFQSYVGGNYDIYKMPIEGAEPERLTTDAAIDSGPDWQPLGGVPTAQGRIAFTSRRDGDDEIFTMNPDGSNETKLTDNITMEDYPAWSPDGTQIAFTTWRDGNAEIYVMDSDGSNQTQLTDNPAYDAEPTWSEDGEFISFTSDRDGNQEIFVIEADGTPVTNLTQDPSSDFSPHQQGAMIVFVSDRSGNNDIYSMNSSGTELFRMTTYDESEYAPAASTEAAQVVFTRGGPGTGHLYVMPIEGAAMATALTEGDMWEYHATWRPDGDWLAFTRAPEGDQFSSQIWLMSPEGQEFAITDTPGGNMHPDWESCGGECAPIAIRHDRTITLKLRRHLVAKGHLVTTDGTTSCSAQAPPVKIQRKEKGGWDTVKKTTTNNNGRYFTHLANVPGKYRAKAPVFEVAGEVCRAAISKTRVYQ